MPGTRATTHVVRLDLADRNSIDAFAKAWDGPLHILVKRHLAAVGSGDVGVRSDRGVDPHVWLA